MDLRPTDRDESGCHPEPVRFAQGKLREGSAVPARRKLMQILRFAQNDSLRQGNAIENVLVYRQWTVVKSRKKKKPTAICLLPWAERE